MYEDKDELCFLLAPTEGNWGLPFFTNEEFKKKKLKLSRTNMVRTGTVCTVEDRQTLLPFWRNKRTNERTDGQ